MRISFTKIVAGLFAAGLLASAPAHAAYGNASAALNNFKIELIDLDLDDDITPSITFHREVVGGSIEYRNEDQGDMQGIYEHGAVSKDFSNGSYRASSAPGSLLAEAHGTSFTGSISASISVNQEMFFTLSPSTRLLFSAEAEVFADQPGASQQSTYAKIGALLETDIDGMRSSESFSQSLHNKPEQRTRFLSGFIETGKSSGGGVLTAETQVVLYRDGNALPPSPVPEPATYGMLAMGLMVLGGAVRRKARKGARQA